MSDLVNRLRGKYSYNSADGKIKEDRDFGNYTPKICSEAADEIDKLQADVKTAQGLADTAIDSYNKQLDKSEQLQADVKELVGRLEINLNVFKLIKMLQESKKDFDFTNIENGISNMETLIQKHKAEENV